ncbi:uncharacterized protein RJT21DRAFT_119387 [Scheffersomyces amazonensis]|uniref:uncharacterized protein n=1 Tax=Scheffersomyces amazonensis TaxID=1078765 RepID=UPI00315CD624
MLRLHRCVVSSTSRRIINRIQYSVISRVLTNPSINNNDIPRSNHIFVRSISQYKIAVKQGILEDELPVDAFETDIEKLKPIRLFPEFSSVDQLINSKTIRSEYFKAIEISSEISEDEIKSIVEMFSNALDLAYGFHEQQIQNFACSLWQTVFSIESTHESISQLQDQMMEQKHKLINMLILSQRYQYYIDKIVPLYDIPKYKDLQNSWHDTLISTFELQITKDGPSFNKEKIANYLSDTTKSIRDRRNLLSTFAESGITSNSSYERKDQFIIAFFQFLHSIGDEHVDFQNPEFKPYIKVIQLLAIPNRNTSTKGHIEKLVKICDSCHIDYSELITTIMYSIPFNENVSLSYFNYKSRVLDYKLNYKDLKYAMAALLNLRNFSKVVDIYETFPKLRHEDQLEVLLLVSERMKDWKAMQKRFEDMYGRGELPFVVHYAIVMSALASIGKRKEVDLLYEQLKGRNLIATHYIHRALIRSRIVDDDIEGAIECFNNFMNDVSNKKVETNEKGISSTFLLVLNSYIELGDLDGALTRLSKTLEDKTLKPYKIVDGKTLAGLISLAAKHSRIGDIVKIQEIANQLGENNEDVSIAIASAYGKFDQYELADKFLYKAHKQSVIPFTNSEIYAFQIRNYRWWHSIETNSVKKAYCKSRLKYIVNSILSNKFKMLSFKNRGLLYRQIIAYLISQKNLSMAHSCLKHLRIAQIIEEDHYLPFLKFYSSIDSFKMKSHVLDLYKRMVEDRVELSVRTHVYILKTMLFLDKHNKTNFQNSHRLLESVLDMNGLSLVDSVPIPKRLNPLLRKNAQDLCQLISDYVKVVKDEDNSNILFRFFNQMRDALGTNMSIEFKSTVCISMSQIYFQKHEYPLALRLVESGINDIISQINQLKSDYPSDIQFRVPRNFQNIYRQLISFKLQYDQPDLIKLLQQTIDSNIPLGGMQYNKIFQKLFDDDMTNDNLDVILKICENSLVSTNYLELFITSTMRRWYKISIYLLAATNSNSNTNIDSNPDTNTDTNTNQIFNKYNILNKYYNVESFEQLQQEFGDIEQTKLMFNSELQAKSNLILHANWVERRVLNNIPSIFVPGKRINSENKIFLITSYELWKYISLIGEEQISILQEKYPRTLNFLRINGFARSRMLQFETEIDKVKPPPFDSEEILYDKRRRWIDALKSMGL